MICSLIEFLIWGLHVECWLLLLVINLIIADMMEGAVLCFVRELWSVWIMVVCGSEGHVSRWVIVSGAAEHIGQELVCLLLE